MANARQQGFIRGLGGMFSFVDVLNRRLLPASSAEADAGALLLPPELMRAYEEVLPGSADRILTMAEREQKLRATYENLGLVFGFVAALALIALSAYVVSLGFAWQSVGIIIGSIAGTAGTFVYSNRSRRKELREKREALQNPPSPPELPESGNDPE